MTFVRTVTRSRKARIDLPIALDAGELLLRTDEVVFRLNSTANRFGLGKDNPFRGKSLLYWQFREWRAQMHLTNRRLVFVPPMSRRMARILYLLYFLPPVALAMLHKYGAPPFTATATYDLDRIPRFFTWQPRFSAPPVFVAGPNSWSFALKHGRHDAPREAVEAHFRDVEAAWLAVRQATIS